MGYQEYKRYRWFYTASGKLVIGGKNAEQNEELIKRLKAKKEDRLIMHTQTPGSPFTAILTLTSNPTKNDIEEAATFTASFSRAWKEKRRKTNVDVFNLSQLYKTDSMKVGTWGVKEEIKRISVPLELVLAIQKSKLRAVPLKSVKLKENILLKIIPGEVDKKDMLVKLKEILSKFNQEEILSVLPSGGIKIIE